MTNIKTIAQLNEEHCAVMRAIARLWNTYTPVAEIRELERICEIAYENEKSAIASQTAYIDLSTAMVQKNTGDRTTVAVKSGDRVFYPGID